MAELLTIDLTGLPEKRRFLAGARGRALDLTPVWEIAHDAFLLEMHEQFATQGRHLLKERWQPLSREYAKRKRTPPAPFGILYRKGLLYLSLTQKRSPNHVAIITPTRAAFGTKRAYARYHQDGVEGTWSELRKRYVGAMPARKIIAQRSAFKRLIFRAAVAWILAGRRANQPATSGATG